MSCRVSRILSAFTAAGLGALLLSPGAAQASPATDSDLMDIDGGLIGAGATVSYESRRVFRGVPQAEDIVRLRLKTKLSAGPAQIYVGADGISPFDNDVDGFSEPTEVDFYGVARFDLIGLTAEIGATYYTYFDEQETGQSSDSLELHAGVNLPFILPVLVRAYYDTELENTTVETQNRWRIPVLGDRLEVELSSVVGYVNQGDTEANRNAALAGTRTLVEGTSSTAFVDGLTGGDFSDIANGNAPAGLYDDGKEHRVYYGVGAAVSSRITGNVKVGANVNWQGTTGEYTFNGKTDDETFWGGASVTVGF